MGLLPSRDISSIDAQENKAKRVVSARLYPSLVLRVFNRPVAQPQEHEGRRGYGVPDPPKPALSSSPKGCGISSDGYYPHLIGWLGGCKVALS